MNKKFSLGILIVLMMLANQAFAQDHEGALSGKRITISPGHGNEVNSSGTSWEWQRKIGYEIKDPAVMANDTLKLCEDKHNYEWVTDFLRPMLERAGAEALMMRAYSYTTSTVTVSNTDPNYEETGTWHNGDSGNYRYAYVTPNETATAVWSFQVPKDDYYPVYVRYFTSDNRVKDAQFTIVHARGKSIKTQDMSVKRMMTDDCWQPEPSLGYSQVGGKLNKDTGRASTNTWHFLGMYPFKAHEKYEVVLSNASSSGGAENVVIADSIKVGDGPGHAAHSGKETGLYWWQEGARSWLEFLGLPEWALDGMGDNHSRTLYSIFEDADAQISLHTNTNNGTVSGTQTYVWYHPKKVDGRYSPYPTPEEFWESNFVENHLPPRTYEYANIINDNYCDYMKKFVRNDWHCDKLWGSCIGEIEGTRNAWYYHKNDNPINIPTALVEAAFADNDGDIRQIREQGYRFIGARAIMAALIKFFNGNNAVIPPMPPINLVATTDADHLNLSWEAVQDVVTTNSVPTEYRIYTSDDGLLFDVTPVKVVKDTKASLPIRHGQSLYVRVTAANAGGESLDSRVGVGRLPNIEQKKVLYVDGVDRELKTAYDPENDRSYTRIYAPAILFNHAGYGIDFVDDEAAPALLADHSYDLVVWSTGQTNTGPEVLTLEQKKTIKMLRDKGVPLLISGSEIGYTFTEENDYKDIDWLANTFGAKYVADSAYPTFIDTIQKVSAPDFIKDDVVYSECIAYGASVAHEVVDAGCVLLPDVYSATNGASVIMNYVGSNKTQTGAAILTSDKKAILAGFPLESIADPNTRLCFIANLMSTLMGESINADCKADTFKPDPEICDNKLDDDGNGKADCDDPACENAESCKVLAVEICDNKLDDDGNGKADCDDPACENAESCKALAIEICDNKLDDDGNGKADCDDPACENAESCQMTTPGGNTDPGGNTEPGGNIDPDEPEIDASSSSDCSISAAAPAHGAMLSMLPGLLCLLRIRRRTEKQ